jgi:hypothetical protein
MYSYCKCRIVSGLLCFCTATASVVSYLACYVFVPFSGASHFNENADHFVSPNIKNAVVFFQLFSSLLFSFLLFSSLLFSSLLFSSLLLSSLLSVCLSLCLIRTFRSTRVSSVRPFYLSCRSHDLCLGFSSGSFAHLVLLLSAGWGGVFLAGDFVMGISSV